MAVARLGLLSIRIALPLLPRQQPIPPLMRLVALITQQRGTSGTTALTDFADTTWSSATITARGGLLFNDSVSGDPTCLVLDFGADKTSTAGDFTVQFPAADASNAIIRIA